VPVVVACHGAALAGGCAIVASADFAVADRAAKLGYPVVLLGVSPAVSGPTLLPRIGSGPARLRMLDPGLIDAVEAARLGLVSALADSPDAVGALANRAAMDFASKDGPAARQTKRWLNVVDCTADDDGLGLEASLGLAGGAEERALLGARWTARGGSGPGASPE